MEQVNALWFSDAHKRLSAPCRRLDALAAYRPCCNDEGVEDAAQLKHVRHHLQQQQQTVPGVATVGWWWGGHSGVVVV